MNATEHPWGLSPWSIDFQPASKPLAADVDFAVIGAGFTGLSAAAHLKRLSPASSVAVFEAASVGSGASGRSGGLTLAETAAGDLPGLGDVLGGFAETLAHLGIKCELALHGAWELSRDVRHADSPIRWQDSGTLCVAGEVPGGTVHPGKLVAGLARVAEAAGASIFEHHAVRDLRFGETVQLVIGQREVRARHVLIATNAESLRLAGLAESAEPKITFAVATEPLGKSAMDALGLASRRPFYTIDMPRPYLWGRVTADDSVIFGAGLADAIEGSLEAVDVHGAEASNILDRLERRVRGLHPALHEVRFTHRWGGPILFTEGARPVFRRHTKSARVLIAAGYNGHGVALSVYLGRSAALVLLGQRELPDWSAGASVRRRSA